MKRSFLPLIFTSTLFCDTPFPTLKQLVPTTSVEANEMKPTLSREALEATQKFQLAVSKNREWFLKYAREKAIPGEVLPYHENFGMTKEEYADLVKNLKNMVLVPAKKTKFLVSSRKDGFIRITIKDASPNSRFIEFNTKTLKVRTPLIQLSNPERLSPKKSALGKWRGYSWKKETGSDPEKSMSLYKIGIGKIVKTGMNFISIEQKIVKQGVMEIQEENIYTFQN